MNLLDLDTAPERQATTGRCRCCRHKLLDPVSLSYGIGPDCRRKLGITPRKPVRIAGVPAGWEIEGQGDLLEDIVANSDLNVDVILAAIRDHGALAYEVLIDRYPSDDVIAEFTRAAREGFTTFGVAVHLATLTDKGTKRLAG
ncbi:DUF6011 domain-containing protein [Nonomuraea sp. MTCD27]|uniref:DUF6011 domain-containing protein n=1 Tax=Nonomuraea sp. MTCD27 TaxID=1676747 RepID=UPI0035BEDEBE